MENGKYFCFNENIFKTGKAVLTADNRSFRFGDGFFETMKVIDENIPLSEYHFERLFTSLQLLKFEIPAYFTAAYLSDKIKNIVLKNNHAKLARIRLTIFRGDGNLLGCQCQHPRKRRFGVMVPAGVLVRLPLPSLWREVSHATKPIRDRRRLHPRYHDRFQR